MHFGPEPFRCLMYQQQNFRILCRRCENLQKCSHQYLNICFGSALPLIISYEQPRISLPLEDCRLHPYLDVLLSSTRWNPTHVDGAADVPVDVACVLNSVLQRRKPVNDQTAYASASVTDESNLGQERGESLVVGNTNLRATRMCSCRLTSCQTPSLYLSGLLTFTLCSPTLKVKTSFPWAKKSAMKFSSWASDT